MPKMKSHSGTRKRVRRTGSGKLVMRRSRRNHLLLQKSKKSKRLNRTLDIDSRKQSGNIERLLPYS